MENILITITLAILFFGFAGTTSQKSNDGNTKLNLTHLMHIAMIDEKLPEISGEKVSAGTISMPSYNIVFLIFSI